MRCDLIVIIIISSEIISSWQSLSWRPGGLHAAWFHGDRPRKLGDLALKDRKNISSKK